MTGRGGGTQKYIAVKIPPAEELGDRFT